MDLLLSTGSLPIRTGNGFLSENEHKILFSFDSSDRLKKDIAPVKYPGIVAKELILQVVGLTRVHNTDTRVDCYLVDLSDGTESIEYP
jgi:hypothetical protein